MSKRSKAFFKKFTFFVIIFDFFKGRRIWDIFSFYVSFCFLKSVFFFNFLKKKVYSQKKKFGDYVGNGKQLKIDFNKLFKKPETDVYKNRACNNKRMGSFRKPFINGSVNDHKNHCSKIEKKIEKINTVQRPINFFKNRNAV